MMERRHYQYLDVLKGVVIFLVVVGHAFHFGYRYYQSAILMALRSIDMPIFLFMSGLLAAGGISISRAGLRDYWLKKSRQLLLPLLGLPVLYALIYRIPASEMIGDMMHGGYWFTLVLFEMFVLLWGVRVANHYVNRAQSPLVEILLALLSVGLVLAIDPLWAERSAQTYSALSWGKLSYLYPYFVVGYFAGKYGALRRALVDAPVHALAGVAFVLLIYAEYTSGSVLGGVPASVCGLIFAYGTAIRLGDKPSRLNRALAYLGKESRTIYLTHYLFLFSVPAGRAFLKGLPQGGRNMMWELLLSFGYAAVVIAVTLVAVCLIKSSDILACLCYGKRIPQTPQRDEQP